MPVKKVDGSISDRRVPLLIEIRGNFKQKVDARVISSLKEIRAQMPDRAIILYGCSRGGRWIYEIALENPTLFDGAVACAGYPPTREHDWNRKEVRQVAHTHSEPHANTLTQDPAAAATA